MKAHLMIAMILALLGSSGCTALVAGAAAGAAGGYVAGHEAAENEADE